ncbi:MAG: hypothetical protein DI536_27285 [Archangium gephyra]|uniref:Uncharacterized protein n=1 Tax=Archangium gephyra TaxID=48 RepID=A0A2W5T0M5_9BACT|nr:MAG: hypothetical protein DI536_27285 [Archangium gephyra]
MAAGSGTPNYLKAAFLNVYNLSLLGGAAVASALTGDWMIGLGALGLEALWLVVGPDLKPFQRAVKESAREEREKEDRKRVDQLMSELPEREWQRAKALDELRREIERDVQHNPSFQAILLATELEKLAQLHASFVRLASACRRAETYLQAVDVRDLERQVKAQESLQEKMTDESVRDLAGKNAAVLKKRLETIKEIETFLARARGQMNLIENSIRLLRDQALTMTSPDQLTEQLDDLLTGVDAVQQSVKDAEALIGGRMEPIAPISSPDERVNPTVGDRFKNLE